MRESRKIFPDDKNIPKADDNCKLIFQNKLKEIDRNYERTTEIRIRKTQEILEKGTFKCETTEFTK